MQSLIPGHMLISTRIPGAGEALEISEVQNSELLHSKMNRSEPNRVDYLWPGLLEHIHLDFISARLFHCTPDWAITQRVISDEMLHLLHSGSIEWQIGDKKLQSVPGDIILCPPGVPWSARRTSEEFIKITVIHFQARSWAGQRYFECIGHPYLIRPHRNTSLVRITRSLRRWDRSNNPAQMLKLRALMFELLFELVEYRGPSGIFTPEAAFAIEVADYLRTNMHRNITRSMLARHFLMNAHSIAARFRRYTGQSPIDYVISLRIRHAQQLLRTSNLRVSEIARRVGYDDVSYFTRLFKQKVGVPPRAYRLEEQGMYSPPNDGRDWASWLPVTP